MATTIDDIIAARNAAVHILDHEIQDALAKQNAAPAKPRRTGSTGQFINSWHSASRYSSKQLMTC